METCQRGTTLVPLYFMEKKNVKEVIKELIPVAVDIISDKLSNKEDDIDTVSMVIDKNGEVQHVRCRKVSILDK